MIMRLNRQILYVRCSNTIAMNTRLKMVVSDVQHQITDIPTGKWTSDEVQSILIVSYMVLHLFGIAGSSELWNCSTRECDLEGSGSDTSGSKKDWNVTVNISIEICELSSSACWNEELMSEYRENKSEYTEDYYTAKPLLAKISLICVSVGISEKPMIIRHCCDCFRYESTLGERELLQISCI